MSEPTPAQQVVPPGQIKAVLFDADGVLQYARDGWFERLDAVAAVTGDAAEAFREDLWRAEMPALRGQESLRDGMTRLAEQYGLGEHRVDELVSLWDNIRPDEGAWQVVRDVRAAGLATYLASNQHAYRRDIMMRIGYGDIVDWAFFSCDLRAAKPEPEYFETVLARLQLPAHEVAFIDDLQVNVEAAARLGIVALWHERTAGAGDLRALLVSVGVRLQP